MYFWPVWDGDSFDLGGKCVEVVHVGGHTPGEIVLVDRADRICFTGDACNDNTLLNLPGSISVEEYSGFLAHFKTFQSLAWPLHGLVLIAGGGVGLIRPSPGL